MAANNPSDLELCLLDVMRRELGSHDATVSQSAIEVASREFLRVLRESSTGRNLTGRSRAAFSEGTARLEEAMTAAVNAGARASGFETDYQCPAVIVQPSDDDGSTIERALEATIQLGGGAAPWPGHFCRRGRAAGWERCLGSTARVLCPRRSRSGSDLRWQVPHREGPRRGRVALFGRTPPICLQG